MEVSTQFQLLKNYIEKCQFRGFDPYDALNSPILRTLSAKSKYLKLIFIQTLRRLSLNLRPILGIRKEHNPKGIGLFLWGYAKLYACDKQEQHLTTIEHLITLLDDLKCRGYSGNCWGYNFDWQSRATFLPKETPTVVNSSFIGHALLDTYEYTGMERALVMALDIAPFILRDLNRTEKGEKFCFSYTPIDSTAVHNANMLAASLLIRLAKHSGDNEAKSAALASLAYSMEYQHQDGSWFYAETDFQKWIDSFHTGFNLQSVLYFLNEGYGQEYGEAFKSGVAFYRENFFLLDGTPKYFHNKIYPIDIHAPAQGIALFSRLGAAHRELAERILSWMITNMQSRQGYFYFRKTPLFTNKISYMRWSQAWVFHALTDYMLSSSKVE